MATVRLKAQSKPEAEARRIAEKIAAARARVAGQNSPAMLAIAELADAIEALRLMLERSGGR